MKKSTIEKIEKEINEKTKLPVEIKEKIQSLREALEQHNYNYYVLSAPIISDRAFDEMMKDGSIIDEIRSDTAG